VPPAPILTTRPAHCIEIELVARPREGGRLRPIATFDSIDRTSRVRAGKGEGRPQRSDALGASGPLAKLDAAREVDASLGAVVTPCRSQPRGAKSGVGAASGITFTAG